MVRCGNGLDEAGSEAGLFYVTMVISHLSRSMIREA